MRSVSVLALLLLAGPFAAGAQAGVVVSNNPSVTLTGIHTLSVLDLSATGNSIIIDLGGGPFATGPLAFELDPGGSSFYIVDFDTGGALEHYEMLVSSPALPPTSLVLEGTGTISDAFQLFAPHDRTDVFLHQNSVTAILGGQSLIAVGPSTVGALQLPGTGAFGFGAVFNSYSVAELGGTPLASIIGPDVTVTNTNTGGPKPAPEPPMLLLLLSGLGAFWSVRKLRLHGSRPLVD